MTNYTDTIRLLLLFCMHQTIATASYNLNIDINLCFHFEHGRWACKLSTLNRPDGRQRYWVGSCRSADGWVDPHTAVGVCTCSPRPRLYIAVICVTNTRTTHDGTWFWDRTHRIQAYHR